LPLFIAIAFLQCCDAVGWATGRATILHQKFTFGDQPNLEFFRKTGMLNKQVQVYYISRTGMRCCRGMQQLLRFHSLGGSSFLHEMVSWSAFWNYGIKSKIRFR